MQISRQGYYKKAKVIDMGFYRKNDDEFYLPMIKEIINTRPTYGYKRVTAMLNRHLLSKNLPIVNKKRVYRIMKINGLILPKTGEKRQNKSGTGKIEVLHSNTRWCSDAFEIKCWNGEKIYIAFSLDCRDREAIHYVAQKRPLLNKDIQELMIFSVEKRFGVLKPPRTIQWLTDRGAIYRSNEVKQLAKQIGLIPCYTAPYSPSSNGMAESFVGTFKRDYVYTNDCSDAKTVLNMLKEWFRDYNSQAPHSALNMKSPWEFIQSNRGVN